ESAMEPDVTAEVSPGGYQITSGQLVSSLQVWSTGVPDEGWVLMSAEQGASWVFASSDYPDVSHRPQLTVEYTPPGWHNPSYVDLAGQPPAATKLAWFDWYDDLLSLRLARVPNARPSTFYFAQDGDDVTGWGTVDRPWKSLAKAEEILEAS